MFPPYDFRPLRDLKFFFHGFRGLKPPGYGLSGFQPEKHEHNPSCRLKFHDPCFEALKFMREKRSQIFCIHLVDSVEKSGDGFAKEGKVRIIFRVKTSAFRKLPQPFNEIQVWRISRKIQKFDAEYSRRRLYQMAFLLPRVVHDQSDWDVWCY